MNERSVDLVFVVWLRSQNDSSSEVFHVASSSLIIVSQKELLDLSIGNRLTVVQNRSNLVDPRRAESCHPRVAGAHRRRSCIGDLLVDTESHPSLQWAIWLAAALTEAAWQRVWLEVNIRNHQSSLEADQQLQIVAVVVSDRNFFHRFLVVVHLLQLLRLLCNALVPRRVVDLIVVEAIRLKSEVLN